MNIFEHIQIDVILFDVIFTCCDQKQVSSHAPSVRRALSPFLGDILSQGVPTKSFHIQRFTANAFAEASEQSVSQECEPSLRDLLC